MNMTVVFVIAAVLIAIAFLIGWKTKRSIIACGVLLCLVGGLFIAGGIALAPASSWRNVSMFLTCMGAFGIFAGIYCFRLEKNRKFNKELDYLLTGVANNAANNYKDAAQKDFKAFLDKYQELKLEGKLTENQIAYYDSLKTRYEHELKGFHH